MFNFQKTQLVYLFIFLDQAIKFYIFKNWPEIVSINKNGSWGILPWWSGIIGVILVIYLYPRLKVNHLILNLILAAGISNILDRVLYNGVVDYITVFSWFPTFNLADVVISIGVGLMIIKELFVETSR